MGISVNLVPTLIDVVRIHELSGALLQLGRQDVEASADRLEQLFRAEGFSSPLRRDAWKEEDEAVTPETFFSALGFDVVESADLSDEEGATWSLDLNEATVPEDLRNRFNVVFDGGTLEHVFNVPNALEACAAMLRPNGWFLHIGPLNNYVDHGFYQFSPTFWFDWCSANGWDVYESALVRLPSQKRAEADQWQITWLPPQRFGTVGSLDDAPYMQWFAARMGPAATAARVPTQAYYTQRYAGVTPEAAMLRSFDGYTVEHGQRKPLLREPGDEQSEIEQLPRNSLLRGLARVLGR